MNPTVLHALKESIVKWEANAQVKQAVDIKTSTDDCPLCQLFNTKPLAPPCYDCPVMKRTGRRYCRATPYDRVLDERGKISYDMSTALLAAIEAEIAFLKSLLPEGET